MAMAVRSEPNQSRPRSDSRIKPTRTMGHVIASFRSPAGGQEEKPKRAAIRLR
jgi:hypothetical protein